MATTSLTRTIAGGESGPSTETRGRYGLVTEEKGGGVTYTPTLLAAFVARQIGGMIGRLPTDRPLRLLDPAVGHGELLLSLLKQLQRRRLRVEVEGFEVDEEALSVAGKRLRGEFPGVPTRLRSASFLDHLTADGSGQMELRPAAYLQPYDLIIANPPYVRTQVMGSKRSRAIARQFGLSGRVDLYYAFVLGIAEVLAPSGVAGIIVSDPVHDDEIGRSGSATSPGTARDKACLGSWRHEALRCCRSTGGAPSSRTRPPPEGPDRLHVGVRDSGASGRVGTRSDRGTQAFRRSGIAGRSPCQSAPRQVAQKSRRG